MKNPLRRPGLVLPIAALIIIALCVYKMNQTHTRPVFIPAALRPLPPDLHFELHDQDSRTMRLTRYLGRHEIIIVFFDPQTGPAEDPVLTLLSQNHEQLKRRSIIVLGISPEIPQVHRKAGDFPFELLTDMDLKSGATSHVRRGFGLVDNQSGESSTGVFYIDRAGRIAWSKNRPQPLPDPISFVKQLIGV